MLPIEQLHPIAIHFPIVLAFVLLAMDSYAALRGRALTAGTCIGDVATTMAGAAAVFALIAFVLGDQAYDIAMAANGPVAALETHEGLGSAAAFAILAWGVLRVLARWRALPISGGRVWLAVAVDLVLCALVVAAAWYGGRLVYDFGVAVSRSVSG
ncbi:MAG: hypothetical protein KDK91_30810 [Gammaproteobacteria bacterium]|nr:hypothetical protein [Gammaproteobacteria bacterium]